MLRGKYVPSFPDAILILLRFYVKGIQTVSSKALNLALPHVTEKLWAFLMLKARFPRRDILGTVAVDTERLICAVAPFMPMKDRAQAHMSTSASKSSFGEQMPFENIRYFPRQFRGGCLHVL